MSLHLITAPTDLPITVNQARSRLKIDSAAEDEYIEFLITALTNLIDGGEGVLGHCLCRQTWEYRIAGFPCFRLELPLPPLASVTSIKYLDTSGVEQTLSSSAYVVIDQGANPAIIQPATGYSWPATMCDRPDAVRILYIAGYLTANIPPAIIAWMLREIGKGLQTRDADLNPDYSEILRYRTITLPLSDDDVL